MLVFKKMKRPWKFAYLGIDVREFREGDKIDDDDEAAELALELDLVRREKGRAKEAPEGDELIDAVVGAIAKLDPARDFTRDGIPSVEALEGVLGFNISAEARDEALERVNG